MALSSGRQVVKNYGMSATAERFHACDSLVRGIMGPFGSGKSTMCCWELMMRAQRQEPDAAGIRWSRWVVVRNTYPELKSTTIKTWLEWFGDVGTITYGSPIEYKARIKLADGTEVDMEVAFLALDRDKDVKKLLSLEVTGGWINEAREVSKAVLDNLKARIGRFPKSGADEVGATWHGIIMDTNPPDDDHWWYHLAEVEQPRNHVFYKQPGGYRETAPGIFEPNGRAENIENLKGGFNYYFDLMDGVSDDWIRVHVCGEYGVVKTGRLVYTEYVDSIHCAGEELQPYRAIPLILGVDFGLTPAFAFCQWSPDGSFRVLDELCAVDSGLRQFVEEVVKPYIATQYAGMFITAWGDPAGAQRSQTDEKTCIDILNSCGIPASPASSNNIAARTDAISRLLLRRNGLMLSSRCKVIRKAFQKNYYYERIAIMGREGTFKDAPTKNFSSHIMNALEYAALGGNAQFDSVQQSRTARPVKRISMEAWT